jgi:transcriptional regulator with XRE-family HTH domain
MIRTRQEIAHRDIFRRQVGRELRELREAYGLSQATVADVFGWNRDAMSKIERGATPLGMFEYLRLMLFYRERVPEHPAVALAARLLPGVPRLPIQRGDQPEK